jgi:cold shock protein
MLMEGTVKWFNPAKGFGFITPKVGDHDYFVHYSQIQVEESSSAPKGPYRTLAEGQRVEFEHGTGAKGIFAAKVRVLD